MTRYDDEKTREQIKPVKQAPDKTPPRDPYNPTPSEPTRNPPDELPGRDDDPRNNPDRPNTKI